MRNRFGGDDGHPLRRHRIDLAAARVWALIGHPAGFARLDGAWPVGDGVLAGVAPASGPGSVVAVMAALGAVAKLVLGI